MAKSLDDVLKKRAFVEHMKWAQDSNAQAIVYRMMAFLNPSKKVDQEEVNRVIEFLCAETKIFER